MIREGSGEQELPLLFSCFVDSATDFPYDLDQVLKLFPNSLYSILE